MVKYLGQEKLTLDRINKSENVKMVSFSRHISANSCINCPDCKRVSHFSKWLASVSYGVKKGTMIGISCPHCKNWYYGDIYQATLKVENIPPLIQKRRR